MKSTEKILQVFIKDYKKVKNPEIRNRYGILEALVSIFSNIFLALIQLIFGFLFNSITILASAFHTLGDVLTSSVVLLSFIYARKKPDKGHPFGHGRIENIACLIIAVLLVVVGWEFLMQATGRIFAPQVVKGSIWVIVVMLLGGLFKEWMARFAVDLGERIGAPALTADAWHHRSDAISFFLIVLAMLGAQCGYFYLDAYFGTVVSLLIIYAGVKIGLNSISSLLGEAPSQEYLHEIEVLAKEVDGVLSVHGILVHAYGDKKAISLHIEVKRSLTLEQAHVVATAAENRLHQTLGAQVVVHIDLEKEKNGKTD